MPSIVLASTSQYRAGLLMRLQIPFKTAAPNVDETTPANESPDATAVRLAIEKARAVAPSHGSSLIIGSDQVAHQGSLVYSKPGTRANAKLQLKAMSGKEITFETGLCVLDANTGRHEVCNVVTLVGFRELSDHDIENYLDREDALNCAGSAKCEGLGISLLRYIRGDDPNALIGLPLIALCDMLRARGVALP